ncbi:MAG TPA: MarR family transcriptional regulator [Stackebrandtia sp.]|jgi:DNA-binding MarR family transcriptional regulator|uniref:MarR family winged helix-turn-helix transcriptional regulator n=1 Tax=Stackebrandtia sp. TaxID=2023065 RepID=UPI002D696D28|nr:MarR family transcriptional regulator [Stackebrandtia sp.]HZE41018.1 MarR family transcriptional regulator [Stackebrandtia sp.]
MRDAPEAAALGTLLRHVLDALDGDVAAVYAERGVPDYRPRFSPYLRALVDNGPLSIRDLGGQVGVTHSAASQTVARMRRADLLDLRQGTDGRQRIAHLTPRAHALLPLVEAEWNATTAAMRDLDAELPMPLSELLTRAARALNRRPMRQRIAESGTALPIPPIPPVDA